MGYASYLEDIEKVREQWSHGVDNIVRRVEKASTATELSNVEESLFALKSRLSDFLTGMKSALISELDAARKLLGDPQLNIIRKSVKLETELGKTKSDLRIAKEHLEECRNKRKQLQDDCAVCKKENADLRRNLDELIAQQQLQKGVVPLKKR